MHLYLNFLKYKNTLVKQIFKNKIKKMYNFKISNYSKNYFATVSNII